MQRRSRPEYQVSNEKVTGKWK